jgi:hypothetical protein
MPARFAVGAAPDESTSGYAGDATLITLLEKVSREAREIVYDGGHFCTEPPGEFD